MQIGGTWHLMRPWLVGIRGRLFVFTILLLAVSTTRVVEPVLYGRIVDTLILAPGNGVGPLMRMLIPLLLLWVGLFCLNTVLDTLSHYIAWSSGHTLSQRLLEQTLGRLMRWSQQRYANHEQGGIVNIVTEAYNSIWRIINAGMDSMLPTLTIFIFVLGTGLLLDWRMTLISLATLPISAVLGRYAWKRATPKQEELEEHWTGLFRRLGDTVTNIGVIQGFAQEERHSTQIINLLRANAKRQLRLDVFWAIFHGGASGFSLLARLLVFAAGAVFVAQGSITVGTLVAFLGLIGYLIGPIQYVMSDLPRVSKALVQMRRWDTIIAPETTLTEATAARDLQVSAGELVLDDVTFRYTTDQRATLHHLSLTVPAGTSCALVGPSGSGKSTIAKLINRLIDPTHGTVFIDGQDIRTVTFASLRRAIGVVSQDTQLFHDTVLNNIRFARPRATRAEIVAACKRAQAHAFIMRLPKGYNSVVGERGVKLSGGERQRLAIARVFLANPPILVLDESTSALDSQTEHKLQSTLARVMKGRTTILIAHRLSTVYLADQIAVIQNGRIEDIGTHDELINRGGLYDRLWGLQVGGYLS